MSDVSIFRCDIKFFDKSGVCFRSHRDGIGVISYMRLGLREKDFNDCRLERAKVCRVLSAGKNSDEDAHDNFIREVLRPYMGAELCESTFVKCHLMQNEARKHLVGLNLDEDTYNKFVEEGWSFNEESKMWKLEVVERTALDDNEELRRLGFFFNEKTGMWMLKIKEKYYKCRERKMLDKYYAEGKYSDKIECWHYDDEGRKRVYQCLRKSF